jgi:tRNA(fMet)-specific endonuclease VapC
MAGMTRYLLDTNTVSHLLRQHPAVVRHVVALPISALAISVITEAELRYGLARRPEAKKLHTAVDELLRRLDILDWNRACTQRYGNLRAALESCGKSLAPLDLLIATHALASNYILVTNDQAFAHVADLKREDWTEA